MNRTQVTTTGGLALLTGSINKLFALFGSYTFTDFGKAFSEIQIADAGMAVLGICGAIYMIWYNEEFKNETD